MRMWRYCLRWKRGVEPDDEEDEDGTGGSWRLAKPAERDRLDQLEVRLLVVVVSFD
jgi:hypothetical protein